MTTTTVVIPPDTTPSTTRADGPDGTTVYITTDSDRLVIEGSTEAVAAVGRAFIRPDRRFRVGDTFARRGENAPDGLLTVCSAGTDYVTVADRHGTYPIPKDAAQAAVAVGAWRPARPAVVGGDMWRTPDGETIHDVIQKGAAVTYRADGEQRETSVSGWLYRVEMCGWVRLGAEVAA